MIAPPVGEMPDPAAFKLRIDVHRVQGPLRGHRGLWKGSNGTQYSAVFEPEDAPGFEGVFNARIEELPGCVSYGEDLATARTNLHEALDLYLEEDAAEQN